MTLTSVGVFYFHGPAMSRLIEYFVKITFQMLKAFYIAEYKSIMIIDRREKDMDPSMHAHAAISDCIFGDKRWTEPNKYGKINIRNDALKSRVDGE